MAIVRSNHLDLGLALAFERYHQLVFPSAQTGHRLPRLLGAAQLAPVEQREGFLELETRELASQICREVGLEDLLVLLHDRRAVIVRLALERRIDRLLVGALADDRGANRPRACRSG